LSAANCIAAFIASVPPAQKTRPPPFVTALPICPIPHETAFPRIAPPNAPAPYSTTASPIGLAKASTD